MTRFESARLKLERAREHLATFDQEFHAFIAANPYQVVLEHDPQRGGNVLRLKVAGKFLLPPRLGVLIGEYVNALRASLDHLVWALLTEEPPRREDVEFPIFTDRTKYLANARKRIGLIPPAAQAEIERLQPFNRGHGAEDHPLWRIHQLSRIDRHRTISVIAHGFTYSETAGRFGINMVLTTPDRLDDDLVFPVPLPLGSNFKAEPIFAVDSRGGESCGTRIALPDIYALYDFVQGNVMAPLERLVPKPKRVSSSRRRPRRKART